MFFSFDLLHHECKNPRKTLPLQNLHLGASLSLAVSWSAAILHDTTHSRRRPQRETEREVEEGSHWLDGAEMSWVLAWRVARYWELTVRTKDKFPKLRRNPAMTMGSSQILRRGSDAARNDRGMSGRLSGQASKGRHHLLDLF